MRLHRSELFFIIMIILLGGVGLMLFRLHQVVGNLSGDFSHSELETTLFALNNVNYLAAFFLITAILSGCMLMVPRIRMQMKNYGSVKIITWTIAKREQDLAQVELIDPLTGMQSRSYFNDALREYLLQFGKINKPVTVLLISIDELHAYYQEYGRTIGDRLICEVANSIRGCTRYHDVLARLDDGVFGLVAPNLREEPATRLAFRISEAVRELRIVCVNTQIQLTVSTGLAVWDGKENSLALYQRANQNLQDSEIEPSTTTEADTENRLIKKFNSEAQCKTEQTKE